MDHPNIARVLDAGATDSGRPYFVMELVRGIPITDYCDQNHLAPRDRLELFVTVCQAVQHAHQKGIIHRDIKPSNVLVTSHDGKPVAKVIDFGVAKAIHQQLTERSIYTQFTQMIGTPLYMSPEQAEMSGLDIDTRSDIYSLGVLLYELLTGTTPFDKKRFAKAAYDEIRRLIREEEPPKPSMRLSTSDSIASIAAQRHTEPAKLSKLIRGDLDWITMKALEKDRTRRYETANGLARDIRALFERRAGGSVSAVSDVSVAEVCPEEPGRVDDGGGASPCCSWRAWPSVPGKRCGRRRRRQPRSDAQQAEASRAEGERLAKLDAQAQKVAAEGAAAKEKAANAQAQKRLTQIEKANDILGSIFENLDPKEIAKGERPLQAILVEKLDTAVAQARGRVDWRPAGRGGHAEQIRRIVVGLGRARQGDRAAGESPCHSSGQARPRASRHARQHGQPRHGVSRCREAGPGPAALRGDAEARESQARPRTSRHAHQHEQPRPGVSRCREAGPGPAALRGDAQAHESQARPRTSRHAHQHEQPRRGRTKPPGSWTWPCRSSRRRSSSRKPSSAPNIPTRSPA